MCQTEGLGLNSGPSICLSSGQLWGSAEQDLVWKIGMGRDNVKG